MAKIKQMQTNFTSGVIAPITIGREDVAFYFNGLEDARNMQVLPSGGVRRRAGLQFIRKIKRKLLDVDMGTATLTAPQGGTAGNVIDGDDDTYLETSNNLGTVNPFVALKIVFPAPVTVDAVDVVNYKLSSGVLDDELRVQYSTDDAEWHDFGTAFNADVTDRSRRACAGDTVTAQYWRVARIGTTDLAAHFFINAIRFLAQSAELPAAPRLVPFAYSTVEAYMMVATDRNMDVFNGDDFVGSIAIPHTDAQMPILNWAQSLDTLALFHPDVRPQRIFRQGDDDEFDYRAYEFYNLPQYDYGAGVGGADEVQRLQNGYNWAVGDVITILLEGYRTEKIVLQNQTTVAGTIQSALRSLQNTSVDGITVTALDNYSFEVVFSGADGKKPWGQMSVSVQSGNSVWTVSRTTKGQYPGEDIMSDARGWARCGLFAQSRLLLGGLKGVPNSVMASTIDDITDFNLESEIDDPGVGLLFRPDSDQVGAVYQIVQGRNISIFMDDGESYFSGNALGKDIKLVPATQSGSKEGMRAFAVEGALLFIQGVKDETSDREIGTSIQEFIYVDTEQNYQSNIVSKLSNHLVRNPIDAAMIKGIRPEDPAIMMLINEDGTAAAYTVLRNELVNAFMAQDLSPRTNEKLKAVGVDKRRRVNFCTERFINNEWVQYLERFNDRLLLDCGDIIDIASEVISAAADGQAVFTYTLDNPAVPEAVGVRVNGVRLGPDDYVVDLGNKQVTLSADVAASVKAAIPGSPGVAAVPATVIRVARMVKDVTGADHLEGEVVHSYIDGSPGDTYVVENGAFTLNDYADTEIQYGFFFDVYLRLLPYRLPGAETLAGEKMRLIKAVISLYETGHLEIRANGGRWQDVPLLRFDSDVLDKSMDEKLFTGECVRQGLKGHAVGGYLECRQTMPAPLTIRSIVREVSL